MFSTDAPSSRTWKKYLTHIFLSYVPFRGNAPFKRIQVYRYWLNVGKIL